MQSILVAARRIYEAAGFHLVRTEPHHSFGRDLIGEYLTGRRQAALGISFTPALLAGAGEVIE